MRFLKEFLGGREDMSRLLRLNFEVRHWIYARTPYYSRLRVWYDKYVFLPHIRKQAPHQ